MKQIYLKCNLAMCKRDTVSAMLKRFDTLIRSTDGVLSGNMIWNKMFHSLNIDAEKEILEAFGIHDLGDKIYGIKSVLLYDDLATKETFLLFNVKNDDEEDIDTSEAAEAFAKIYAKLNSVIEETGIKIAANIATNGINIESYKDNLAYRIIIPKRELNEVVDITIPIENAIDTVIKKLMD